MAGMKGRSGGARPGAGRKPKPPATKTKTGSEVTRDPLEFLLDVMQGNVEANPGQIRAATAAAQYVHAKKGKNGKKDEKLAGAKDAARGKYAPSAPPRLAAVHPIK